MSALVVVVVDVLPEHEDEFNRWYDEEHIPQKRSTPGFRSARRFRSHDVPGRYLALYEVDDAGVVTNPEYMAQPMTEWAELVMSTWRLVDRSVWTELDADRPQRSSAPSASSSIGSRIRTMPR